MRNRYGTAAHAGTLVAAALAIGTAASAQVIGVTAGYVPSAEETLYLDDPCDCWLDRDGGLVLGGQYYWQVSPPLLLGVYGEWESIGAEDETGSRVAGGVTFSARYPATGTALQVGGNLGVGSISLPNDLDSQFGFESSLFVGPVFPLRPNLDLGIHLVPFHGWYSGGDSPEGVQVSNPRVRLQLLLRR